ncbi:hypothetical protein M3Y98_00422100 [Aphelenchoides besseyi]|nr:hypothetical protein M3Y98_00422100 [Aphelenchoides besseyi]
MSLFNETNQLGREVSELKKLVKSMDTKVKQLQKQVQKKSAVEIEHEDVESRVYSPHEVVVKTRKGIDSSNVYFVIICGIFTIIIILMTLTPFVLLLSERVPRNGQPCTSYNNQSDS